MTREEALGHLSSTDSDVRLGAARFFAMNATSGDRPRLRNALHKESVPWIKRALVRSLHRAGPAKETADAAGPVYADPPARLMSELRASAIEEVSGTIVHELAHIVASLKLIAPRDIPNYVGSRTETLVNSLAGLLSGIRNLKAAAGKVDFAECDLARECRDACGIFIDERDIFRFAGPSPFFVEIDPNLLKLALTNIIKNAVESVNSLSDDADRTVTLNWGRAGHEYWVSVLDSGLGFDHEPSTMVEFGKSTKNDHVGFGLATSRQAMQALEGDVYPANAIEGGARVELRWFGSDENSVR